MYLQGTGSKTRRFQVRVLAAPSSKSRIRSGIPPLQADFRPRGPLIRKGQRKSAKRPFSDPFFPLSPFRGREGRNCGGAKAPW